jgi:hypothetical protein
MTPAELLRSRQVKMECIQFLSVSPVIEMEENKQSYWKEVCKRTVENIDKHTVSTFVGPPKFQDLIFTSFYHPMLMTRSPNPRKMPWTSTLDPHLEKIPAITHFNHCILHVSSAFPSLLHTWGSRSPSKCPNWAEKVKSVNMLGISWYHLRVSNNILKIHITHT